MFYFSKIHKAISYNLKAFSKDIIKWTYSTGVRPCVEGGQTDRPGLGSLVWGRLCTTGLQDRLVRTMAAMISSISTDSGLRKLNKRNIIRLYEDHLQTLAYCSLSLTSRVPL